ncbi:hypothetical protein HETIRDRAFT_157711 [Heterobasidion irregulare TC 32-1]|uniref:Transmembrane protein n=1 Tax=Heterobasidion irregulare (strain TC 32-1) TaxID=747525 RepID=W4JMR9_HETIT|nr:uncharacterized protein HETIRDRAFT_157711 [Heterobasidion irregulare TC 32-1]ETW74847.1 hypothetical protein HETIRDRAFT_157711 [Heterobasidion irregulare TC 32-1]
MTSEAQQQPTNSNSTRHPTAIVHQRAFHAAASDHAVLQIIQIWQDRLQLISVVASFFTSIDSILLSLVSAQRDHKSTDGKLMDATIAGALIFHAGAAFTASFVLIRYKLNDAKNAPASPSPSPSNAAFYSTNDKQEDTNNINDISTTSTWPFFSVPHRSPAHPTSGPTSPAPLPFPLSLLSHATDLLNAITLTLGFGSRISVSRVHIFTLPWRQQDPSRDLPDEGAGDPDSDKGAVELTRLLTRCHAACTAFSLAGFVLLIVGVLAYVWEVLARSVSIFVSCCVGLVAFVWVVALH